MKNYLIAILLLTLFVLACNNANDKIHFSADIKDSSEVIDVSNALSNGTYSIESFIDSIKIIKLEDNYLSIISDIRQVVTTSDKIYVLDGMKNGSVALFNIDGSFVRRLPIGAAPHEISLAERIFWNQDDSILYVYDQGTRRIVKYTSEGDFVSYDQESILFVDFAALDGKYVLCNLGFQNSLGQYTIIVKDSINYDYNILGSGWENSISLPYIQCTERECLLTKEADSFIYCYDGQRIYKRYNIVDSNSDFDIAMYENPEEMVDALPSNVFVFDRYFMETQDFQIFDLVCKSKTAYSTFLRKRTSASVLAIDYGKSIFNAFEYCPKIGVHNYQDNIFNAVVTYESLHGKCFGSDEPRWDGSNMNGLISDADMEKLKAVTPDDNPIIVFFKLKDDI